MIIFYPQINLLLSYQLALYLVVNVEHLRKNTSYS